MSIIAQKWVYSTKVGNPTAKAILAFLASHNFAGDQSCFRIKTIAAALELDIRTVQESLKFLADKGFIKKEARFAESGQQLTNEYTLNIPKDYIEKSYKDYDESYKSEQAVDKSRGGVVQAHPPHGLRPPPGVVQAHPLNTNKENNNINKKHLYVNEQKQTTKFWEPGNPDYDRLHG